MYIKYISFICEVKYHNFDKKNNTVYVEFYKKHKMVE